MCVAEKETDSMWNMQSGIPWYKGRRHSKNECFSKLIETGK